ncbi:AAA family ATPase [Glycomyces sp. A-F 0318]|uniref:AAA family ATPase n=1 Tax=Glycomyces amatae TaxID=2881355 RepID=UPI001E4E342A|nr:AAA family ATPase [Glycomyces amatae]
MAFFRKFYLVKVIKTLGEKVSIDRITIQGYKALKEAQTINIRRLTVNAGVNSSGKSSMMQPLLLLKQTLEAPYDPGPLLLDGPNVNVTEIEKVLSKGQAQSTRVSSFSIGVGSGPQSIQVKFGKDKKGDIKVQEFELKNEGEVNFEYKLKESLTQRQITEILPKAWMKRVDSLGKHLDSGLKLEVVRDRWALNIGGRVGGRDGRIVLRNLFSIMVEDFNPDRIESDISRIIHLPALRGNPERTYRTAAVEGSYPGQFHDYAAGIISAWQNRGESEKTERLKKGLEKLGLSWKVEAKRVDDTRVELVVGRLLKARQGGANDVVNIADVGFGVSQTLPVVVALIAARPGQLVYLEQPEIHLHPKAQYEFGEIIIDAVLRGVKVVVETHSDLLIRAIQTKVAEGVLRPEDVGLNWFKRNPETGFTDVETAELESDGSFGDWPEDLDQVYMMAESKYLEAAVSRIGRRHE